VLADFGVNKGWDPSKHVRLLADINKDGKSDIVGFGDDGVWTALAISDGGFAAVRLVLGEIFGCAGEHNFVVAPGTVCRCDAGVDDPCLAVAQNWRHTVDNLLEVSAGDFTNGDFVGTECQGETGTAWEPWPFYFNSWRPVDGFKRSMAATLHHFNWNYDDDEDWNIHMIPDPAFSFLISDVEALHDEAVNDHKICGDLPCMEAEISPDKQFWTNPWFFAPGVHPADLDDNGYSWLEGRQMGFYGLWIMDANHDFKSEIHPAEMMWFKDHFEGGFGGSGPFDIFWLLFMQDNTGRFDDRDNFDCGGDAPAGWEPWAQSPRSGQFNVAFVVDPAGEAVNFSIVELFKRFVVTSQDANARRDADDGKSHALEYNGKVVVRVQEDQPNDDDLGVTFTNICLRPDGKLQGFVSIRSKIGGDDDKDEEGFHILYVARSLRSTRPDIPRPSVAQLPRLLITSKEVDGSLRGTGDYFTGDIQLTLHGNDSTSDSDYTISKVEFAGQDIRQEIRFEQNKQTKEVLIRNLPLVTDGRITITSASGLTLTLRTPALSLHPTIDDTLTRSVVDTDAWKFLSASVGGIAGASLPNDKKLARLQELQFQLHPGYAAYKGTEVMTDKASSFASEVNQAIVKNEQKKLEDIFKSAEPFTIAWTFEATNLSTGKPVPVYTDNKPGSEGVQIELLSGKLRNDSLKVEFLSPGSTGIIECRAKASVADTKGKTAIVERRLWSHGFQSTINTIDECASLVQTLTGLKDRSMLIAPHLNSKPQEISLPLDVKTRRAHIMNAYLRATLRDRQVTIEELRNIIRALKKFSVI
jgi:hypothetical protein